MTSARYTTKTSTNHTSNQLPEAHDLILRFYTSLLNNYFVQNGIKQLTRLSQPIIGRLDNSLSTIKNNVGKWVSRDNIYSRLTHEWLADNLPFKNTVISYDRFAKKMHQKDSRTPHKELEAYSRDFYDIVTEIWEQFSDPHLDDIKNAMLATIAKLVSKIHHFEGESLATGLYNMLRMVIEKRRELVSVESYFNLVRLSLDRDYFERHQETIRTACNEYYSFAKRFLLIDFPLATSHKNLLKVTLDFLQDNLFVGSDFTLNFIERHLDTLLNFIGQKPQGAIEDHNLVEKTQRILSKALVFSAYPFKKIKHRLNYVKDSEIFTNLENWLHVSDRIDDAIGLTAWAYISLRQKIINPTIEAIRVTTDKTKSQAVVIMHGLEPQVLKKRYVKLRNQFHVLKKCVVILEESTVKLIFDKKAQAELGNEVKSELLRFYNEVKSLERRRIVNITVEYYAQLIKKAKKTYTRARKLVYYEDGEKRIQNKEKKVEPSEQESTSRESESHVESEQRAQEVEIAA